MASTAGKRQSVTVAKRLEIIQKLEAGVNPDRLVAEYGVSERTIRRYQTEAAAIRRLSKDPANLHLKRRRKCSYQDMETQLYKWVVEMRSFGNFLTNSLLQEKAKELQQQFGESSNFTASGGWLYRFKKRYNICLENVYGETTDADECTARKFIDELAKVLEEEDFKEDNIYNMVESSLMWKALPTRMLIQGDDGVKIKKERVTVAFCANATGSHKLPLLFIHKYSSPTALKHCKNDLPVVYKHQHNSSISTEIFSDWYENEFKVRVRERQLQQQRTGKVLLLFDNFKEHIIPKEDRGEDEHFKFIFLPPNTTAIIKPIDQDIIAKCKKLFRCELLRKALRYSGRIKEFYANYDIRDCIDLISASWDNVLSENIKNSWKKLLATQPSIKNLDTNTNLIRENSTELSPIISSEEVAEWMSQCEEAESITEIIRQEEATISPSTVEEEEIDRMFHNLEKWAKTQPDYIKSHATALLDYYNKK